MNVDVTPKNTIPHLALVLAISAEPTSGVLMGCAAVKPLSVATDTTNAPSDKVDTFESTLTVVTHNTVVNQFVPVMAYDESSMAAKAEAVRWCLGLERADLPHLAAAAIKVLDSDLNATLSEGSNPSGQAPMCNEVRPLTNCTVSSRLVFRTGQKHRTAKGKAVRGTASTRYAPSDAG